MKKVGILAAAAVVALTAYNTWQVRRLAGIIDQRHVEAATATRLELALEHTRRARVLLNQNDTREASVELDLAMRDVTVAATRSRRSSRSLINSVRQGFSRAGKRVREALRGKKERRA